MFVLPSWPASDYASNRQPPVTRRSRQQTSDAQPSRSAGDWLPFEERHALIEAGDEDGLAARVMLTPTFRQFRFDPEGARRHVPDLHGRFFQRRLGRASRVAS